MHIRLIQRSDIDLEKWDNCLNTSDSPLIYGKSWYLDIFTENCWTGLIVDDYSAVMPLFVKRKWNIDYIIQPFLCQQGGIFGNNIDKSTINSIFKFLDKKFKFYCIFSNRPIPNFVHTTMRNNQILELKSDLPQLKNRYNRNTKRNILFAESRHIKVELENDTAFALSFFKSNDETGLINLHQNKIYALLDRSQSNNNSLIYKAVDQNDTVSMAFFIKEDSRYYFLLCASSPFGKDTRALYLIVDTFIRFMSSQNCILDFTGSQIPNIARRNYGFGAEDAPYYQIQSDWYRKSLPLQKILQRFFDYPL